MKQFLKHFTVIRKLLRLVRKPVPMKYVSYGEKFPNTTFYIIGRDNMVAGGWSLVNTVLMHLAFAHDHGYVPVVDMQNYRNQYMSTDDIGHRNFWERFFYQPAGFSLEDISEAKHVIINSSQLCPAPEYNTSDGSNIWEDKPKLDFFRQIYAKYIKYNDRALSYFETRADEVLKGKKNVIGVLCRGSDFLINKPTGHEVQPAPETVLSDVKTAFDGGCYDGVFIATEDQDILDLFKSVFGQHLLYIDQVRISKKDMKGNKWLSAELRGLENSPKMEKTFLAYFSATYILTKCRCLFAGRNNGSKGILYMNPDYDFVKIYNLGKY